MTARPAPDGPAAEGLGAVLAEHEYGYESRAVPSVYCSCGWENDDLENDNHDAYAAHVAAVLAELPQCPTCHQPAARLITVSPPSTGLAEALADHEIATAETAGWRCTCDVLGAWYEQHEHLTEVLAPTVAALVKAAEERGAARALEEAAAAIEKRRGRLPYDWYPQRDSLTEAARIVRTAAHPVDPTGEGADQ